MTDPGCVFGCSAPVVEVASIACQDADGNVTVRDWPLCAAHRAEINKLQDKAERKGAWNPHPALIRVDPIPDPPPALPEPAE